MQQKIHVLDHHEAIKIAAGEVIERPANIIKELIENSIDAGAHNITIQIHAAGKDLIKITDDGCGMSEIDAQLCFAHHATSKIKSVNDLHTIATYGFRGEALSSIAAISTVELTTKTAEQKVATHIKIDQSKCIEKTSTAHPTGTTISITNLFENIPARKKFLKSDDTEWNQIVTIFQAFCLRYLDISFKLYHNDHVAYHCPKTTSIITRCAQLWNTDIYQHLIELPITQEKNITLWGSISTPHYYRFNRGQIFTFVNNRWVKNQELAKGIIQGYQGCLPHQKFPAAFIFITIDPTLIDINVHPKKEEVKFLNPGIIQTITTRAVQKALEHSTQSTLTVAAQPTAVQEVTTPQTVLFQDTDPFQEDTVIPQATPAAQPTTNTWSKPPTIHHAMRAPQTVLKQPEQINIKLTEATPCTIIGQFNATYIIMQRDQELIMVDQHAAHERIIYQRLMQEYQSASVQLMFPHIAKMSASNVKNFHLYQHILSQHGIETTTLSEHEITITATPVSMQAAAAQEIIMMLADLITHDSVLPEDIIKDKIVAAKACKMACKAGDILDMVQMQQLIKELMLCKDAFCCPHGRPTMWTQNTKEIEKHFKRDYVGNKQKNMSL